MTRPQTLLLLFLTFVPVLAAAGEKPTATVVPLKASGAVAAPVQKRFDAKLREAVKAYATVVEAGAAEKADGRCGDSACLKKVATGGKTRFALSGEVSNADDIYKVSLTLYDAATDKLKDSVQECELCAAEEVDRSIVAAVDALKAELAAPLPPPPLPAAPPPPPKVELAITSDPPGADLTLDGQPAGKTPYSGQVAKGKHKATLAKAGFVDEVREFEVADRPVAQEFLLQVVATPPPGAPTEPAEPAEPTEPGAGPPTHTTAGILLAVAGAVAIGVGGYLTYLDGEVTCTDKGRRECPNVYNTKVFGATAIALGAGAIGSGITLFVLPAVDAIEPAAEPDAPAPPATSARSPGLVFRGVF